MAEVGNAPAIRKDKNAEQPKETTSEGVAG